MTRSAPRKALPLPLTLTTALTVALLTGCGTQVRNPVTGQLQRTVMDEQ